MAYRVRWSDGRLNAIIGNVLGVGVVLSAVVLLAGAAMYLRHPEPRGAFGGLRSIGDILHGVMALDSRAIMQFGLVLVISTPIARVLAAFVGFTMQRDRTYMAISAIVLAVLLLSLAGGVAAL